MRLNVKLSPDQERQLLESSMVPLTNEEDHILVIETASAMPAPAAVQQLMPPPATLASPGPGVCNVGNSDNTFNPYSMGTIDSMLSTHELKQNTVCGASPSIIIWIVQA